MKPRPNNHPYFSINHDSAIRNLPPPSTFLPKSRRQPHQHNFAHIAQITSYNHRYKPLRVNCEKVKMIVNFENSDVFCTVLKFTVFLPNSGGICQSTFIGVANSSLHMLYIDRSVCHFLCWHEVLESGSQARCNICRQSLNYFLIIFIYLKTNFS